MYGRLFDDVIFYASCYGNRQNMRHNVKTTVSVKRRLTQGASLLALAMGLTSVSAQAAGYNSGWGFDEAGMNRSVKAGDNFFEYANGTYLKNLKIPGDMSSYGPFRILYELSMERQKAILNEAQKHVSAEPSDDMGKIGTFYASFLDQKAVDALGAKPLAADLEKIRKVNDARSLAEAFGSSLKSMAFSTFQIGVEQDQKDPEHYMLMLDQGMSIGVSGGLGLPDISYYTDPKLADKKKAYQAYIARMLTLEGWPDAAKNAQAVVDLETALAKVEVPRDQTRDPLKIYNPMPVSQLQKIAPDFDWTTFLTTAGLPAEGLADRKVDVREPEGIAAMSRVLKAADYNTLQAWLAFHLADNAATYLSHDFSDASFDFNGKTLSGIAQQSPRWKRGTRVTNGAMGWAIGQIYVARYFPPSAQAQITALVQEVKSSFHDRLEHNTWMDEPTRKAALNKLDHFALQVGYPKKWWDYSNLVVRKGDVYGNAVRGAAFNWQHELNKLDKPVDRDEWGMTPQTVNAYNDPTMNEIVFPAAILQPPFFDPKGDMAVNYGAIGGVIGHEMSHGFDDQGRHYDEHGRLNDWWSKASSDAFQKLADRLGAQYDAQEPLPGTHVNGKMTMGENIADSGGLNLGLQAYHDSLHGKPETTVHGLTGDQRVFLGWAQVWREKDRPDALRQQMLSNEHAPAVTRVNMPAHNIDAWYDAFGVKEGDKLYLAPDQRVKIW
ncbi:M13 family metallopeptidase [Gluconobacter thailandicus]|uniref:M13 family metallopeptidase n=1 Tax=Gluconobacter thailandicus TaxID=257438 RepID=A0AAP9ETB3_GLUTH|nr:M13 family metallopeptidase [Gluconobacter thailandicus]KXV33407.1 peptidase M13 [Gluconobacter thailandicus]QEH96719.1 M13 family metallopeptidase [Gluconobacter thailandicus]